MWDQQSHHLARRQWNNATMHTVRELVGCRLPIGNIEHHERKVVWTKCTPNQPNHPARQQATLADGQDTQSDSPDPGLTRKLRGTSGVKRLSEILLTPGSVHRRGCQCLPHNFTPQETQNPDHPPIHQLPDPQKSPTKGSAPPTG
ncbi:unnamed protein product [Calypogeia fissa]